MKKMISFIKYNLKLLFRDMNTILFSFLMPIGFYFLFSNMLNGMPTGETSIQELLVPLYTIIIISNAVLNVFGVFVAQAKETGNLLKYKFIGMNELMYAVTLYIATLIFQIAVILIFLLFSYFYKGVSFPFTRILSIAFVLAFIHLFQFSVTYFLNAMINKSTLYNSVALTFYMFQMFLGGLTFPLQMFPKILRNIVYIINPIIYGRNALVDVWTTDKGIFQSARNILILSVITIALLIIGKIINSFNEKGKTQQPLIIQQ